MCAKEIALDFARRHAPAGRRPAALFSFIGVAAAAGLGTVPAVFGQLYNFAWFTSFGAAFAVYLGLMYVSKHGRAMQTQM